MNGTTKEKNITIKNAHVHNLKGVNVTIPRNKFVVITGLSGSGKTSLAFDTLYAEGQRRYVESLSSYARQFLGRMEKPAVDSIEGISPAIAIEQKVTARNPRSTVGTTTEIYDYLKLLFARVGRTFSPVTGEEVKRDYPEDVLSYINRQNNGERILILCPFTLPSDRSLQQQLDIYQQQGYTRIYINGETIRMDEIQDSINPENAFLVIDRIAVKKDDEDNNSRILDSSETAFFEGKGVCIVVSPNSQTYKSFSQSFEQDGIPFIEPSVHLFSFNNPVGACPSCEGYGHVIGIDEDLVVPDKSLSVYEEAVVAWRGEKMQKWKNQVINGASAVSFPIHKPYRELSAEQREMLWNGCEAFKGISNFFKYVEKKSYKIQYRVMLSRYRGKTVCPECKGKRLRKEATYVKIDGVDITELVDISINSLLPKLKELKLTETEQQISKRLMIEISNRLQYLIDVGVGYLTLNRLSNTLSGGESQRINLATSLGSSLVGSMYILDEPSIGLHPRDTHNLIKVLRKLQQLGNTVIVVEHDEEIMKAADYLIDLGPKAGHLGGKVVFQGPADDLKNHPDGLTAQYLLGATSIDIPKYRRNWKKYIGIEGASHHNLKHIDVKFPLGVLTVVTGVSGSGKSSLVKGILYPAIKKLHGGYGEKTGAFDKLNGQYADVTAIEYVDQNPIGKSSRSNPATYIKAYDDIRSLFAGLPLAKMRGYKPSHFSFNTDGGRCEACQGEGTIKVEMQFMADIHLTCETCKGKRFKEDILEITYNDKNIYDVLSFTVREAIDFFSLDEDSSAQKVVKKIQPLADVGLGYVQLGQSSSTLSGGEAQRIKLASFLAKKDTGEHILFLFDEPTTGLHFDDIKKLLKAFNSLIEKGHSVLVIEHNTDVMAAADWIIDLGPEGGNTGGNVVAEGPPEEIILHPDSHTGYFLKPKLNQ